MKIWVSCFGENRGEKVHPNIHIRIEQLFGYWCENQKLECQNRHGLYQLEQQKS